MELQLQLLLQICRSLKQAFSEFQDIDWKGQYCPHISSDIEKVPLTIPNRLKIPDSLSVTHPDSGIVKHFLANGFIIRIHLGYHTLK
jgi:hypothetical protein